MTEQEKWQYNLLDDENKKKLNLVLDELKPYVGKELTILETISEENVNTFLTDNNIPIYPNFKDSLNTPFAIMRYLSLYDEQEELTKKLNEFLMVNKTDDFDYFILKQFKNEVVFNVKDKGELKVKYIYDQENDKFNFYLTGNTRGFKISFTNIKMLLTDKISTENLPNINTNNKDNISLIYNGMKIIIQKQ